EILVPSPGDPRLAHLAQLAGVALVSYACRYDGRWSLDAAELFEAISERTRAIVVGSPSFPTGAYLDADALDALASLDGSAEGWARPTGLGLTVAQVAAHLGAAFDYAAGVVGAQGAPAPPQGPAAAHRAYTAAATAAADPARGQQLRRQCEASLRRHADWAAAAPAAELRRLVPYEGAEAPVLLVLTARAFEAWAHGEHVRAALGLPAAEPPPEDLALLCDVAVSLVPVAHARAGGTPTGRSARVVLLGPGGGTWLVSDRLGDAAADPAAASATVVLGAFDLCRLTGGLASFDDVARQVEGDRSFAARLVSSLAVFAE
ncbi:MAG: aminotransferase class I/II-fold pyridoxal phosphate-dependent enzyme, partial [Acidimicrobiales bacterium]